MNLGNVHAAREKEGDCIKIQSKPTKKKRGKSRIKN